MSARLEASLASASAGGQLGLVPYLTAGDGGFEATFGALEACAAQQVAAVELGLAFREPVADGPTLIAAAQRALDAGATFEGYLDLARRFRSAGHTTPLLCFTYANALYGRGVGATLERLFEAGFDGLMVPDLPFEESADLRRESAARELALVQFAAPTTSDGRLASIASASRGFLYLVARTGTTGRTSQVGSALRESIGRARRAGAARIGVGFGLREAEQIRQLRGVADLAVVGSALVDAVHREVSATQDPRAAARGATERFLEPLTDAARCATLS